MRNLLIVFSIFFISTTHAATNSGHLGLNDYLTQVRNGNTGIRASEMTSGGAITRSGESALIFSPALTLTTQWYNDAKPSSTSIFTGDKMTVDSFNLGINQMTNFGLNAKLGYSLNYTSLQNTNPLFVTQPKYYEASPSLELSYPFLRNGFGREMRATRNLLEAQALASSYGERFKTKMTLAEAEGAYWRLALARETVKVTGESVERAQKIRDWNSRRVNMQLADKADLLQAEALLQARKFELETARDEEDAARRAFNTMRGMETSDVTEELNRVDNVTIDAISLPERAEMRDDVLAAREQEKLLASNASIGREKNMPNLDLFGSIAMNGRDDLLGKTTSESFGTNHPTYVAGVKFSMPLDIGTLSDARRGYMMELEGASLAFQRKLFEQERDWQDLNRKLADAKKRLLLAMAIEEAQKEKLLHEKERLHRGRTVTFQVLTFEQDYDTAQLNRIRTQAEILRIIAQMKTYGSDK